MGPLRVSCAPGEMIAVEHALIDHSGELVIHPLGCPAQSLLVDNDCLRISS